MTHVVSKASALMIFSASCVYEDNNSEWEFNPLTGFTGVYFFTVIFKDDNVVLWTYLPEWTLLILVRKTFVMDFLVLRFAFIFRS